MSTAYDLDRFVLAQQVLQDYYGGRADEATIARLGWGASSPVATRAMLVGTKGDSDVR